VTELIALFSQPENLKDKEKNIVCGKLGIPSDHPHRRVEIKFCPGGSLRGYCSIFIKIS